MNSGRYIQVRTDDTDTTVAAERMVDAAKDWLERACQWKLIPQAVTVTTDPDKTLEQDCGSVVVDAMSQDDTYALVVGFASGSPLAQRHLLRLAQIRHEATESPLLVVQMLEMDRLSAAIEFNDAMLSGDRLVRPVMVLPMTQVDAYEVDFDGALDRYGLRLITQDFGVTVRSIDQVATVLKRELRFVPMVDFSDDCLTTDRLRTLAKGTSRISNSQFDCDVRHVASCKSCSAASWDFATIERFAQAPGLVGV